jgi:hypothetical protein
MLHGLRLLRLVSRIRIALVSRIGLAFDVGIRTGLDFGFALGLDTTIGSGRNGVALGQVTGSRRPLVAGILYGHLPSRRFLCREAHVERQLL